MATGKAHILIFSITFFLVFGMGFNVVFASLTEVKTECDLTECFTTLRIDKPVASVYKDTKTNYKNLPNTNLHLHKGFVSIGDIDIDKTGTYITIRGKIEPGSSNYWGMEILGDKSFIGSTWWNSTFENRRQYNFTNNDNVVLENLTIKFWLNHEGNATASGKDIRVYNDTENTPIPFGLRNVNSTHAEIVLKRNFQANQQINSTYVYFRNNTPVDFANVTWNDAFYIYWDTSEDGVWSDKWNDDDLLGGESLGIYNNKLCVNDTNTETDDTIRGAKANGTEFIMYEYGYQIDYEGFKWSASSNTPQVRGGIGLSNSSASDFMSVPTILGINDGWTDSNGKEFYLFDGTNYHSSFVAQESIVNLNITENTSHFINYYFDGTILGNETHTAELTELWFIYDGHKNANYNTWCVDNIYYWRVPDTPLTISPSPIEFNETQTTTTTITQTGESVSVVRLPENFLLDLNATGYVLMVLFGSMLLIFIPGAIIIGWFSKR